MPVQLRLSVAVLLSIAIGHSSPASAGSLGSGSLATGAFVIALSANDDEDEANEEAGAEVDSADEGSDEMAADEVTDNTDEFTDEGADDVDQPADESNLVADAASDSGEEATAQADAPTTDHSLEDGNSDVIATSEESETALTENALPAAAPKNVSMLQAAFQRAGGKPSETQKAIREIDNGGTSGQPASKGF